MKLMNLVLAFLFVSISSYASVDVVTGLSSEETVDLYKGYRVDADFYKSVDDSVLRNLRAGLHYLAGSYENNGPTISNLSTTAGFTLAQDTWYWENDLEVSQNDKRKPYWSTQTQIFTALPSSELGVGYREAQFSAQDLKLFLLTYRYYLGDKSFVAATAYLSASNDDLNAYRISLKLAPLFQRFFTEMSYAWGRSLEDVGVEQDFKTLYLGAGFSATDRLDISVNFTRSWGELIDQNYYGVVGLWKF
ncbi:hypothetical protein [Bdellovibrio reynosensis]|uniref:Transporter n=1 Tax=Bdellovibrio reynosensis TaxID=2835041 RepID=A0ABY4CGG0_9BACT|nr:hypothetical protein [Bdellovibrio reynosensis]UOF02653.1 hypothetical protein MNR06_06780 [Bdellovibrio reynosensis]